MITDIERGRRVYRGIHVEELMVQRDYDDAYRLQQQKSEEVGVPWYLLNEFT